jgi:hypothetical protein
MGGCFALKMQCTFFVHTFPHNKGKDLRGVKMLLNLRVYIRNLSWMAFLQ